MYSGLRDRIARAVDHLLAGDPGLNWLRQAFAAVVSVGTTLAVEYGVARLMGADSRGTLVAMLLGAVVAMMGSNALTGTGFWTNARTAAFFPVAVGAGMVIGVGVGNHTDVMLAVFIVVMFVAVFIRRFGLPMTARRPQSRRIGPSLGAGPARPRRRPRGGSGAGMTAQRPQSRRIGPWRIGPWRIGRGNDRSATTIAPDRALAQRWPRPAWRGDAIRRAR